MGSDGSTSGRQPAIRAAVSSSMMSSVDLPAETNPPCAWGDGGAPFQRTRQSRCLSRRKFAGPTGQRRAKIS
eukprot:631349-Pyramimonas_sp.AAC.1